MKPDDPMYRTIVENLDRLHKIIDAEERRDMERINNNIANEVKEDEVRVDMAKVKTDRLREWLGFGKTGLSVGASLGLGWLAYKGEVVDFKLVARNIWDVAKNLASFRK